MHALTNAGFSGAGVSPSGTGPGHIFSVSLMAELSVSFMAELIDSQR
jgi:hypothetical protein